VFRFQGRHPEEQRWDDANSSLPQSAEEENKGLVNQQEVQFVG